MAKIRKITLKRLRILITLGIFGFCITLGLVVWAGISTFNYVATKTSDIIQYQKTAIEASNMEDCWGTAQRLAALEPWLEKALLYNLKSLRVACLDEDKKTITHTIEGGTA